MISSSVQDTNTLARDFLETLDPGAVVALVGDLGSGKTTFVQGVGEALEIEEPVTSPTFVLWRQYETENERFRVLHHFDLYRLESEQEVYDLGMQDVFSQTDGLVLVEWADKFVSVFPERTIWLRFRYIGEERREIEREKGVLL